MGPASAADHPLSGIGGELARWAGELGIAQVVVAHSSRVLSAAWSPDGLHIVSASNDGTVRIWNADGTGEPIVLRQLNKEDVNSASWSPMGRASSRRWGNCSMCNDHKGNRIAAADPDTGEIVRLFDPRRQVWREHFGWSTEGDQIVGKTATGRATTAAIRLNRAEIVEARRGWVIAGWHPPED